MASRRTQAPSQGAPTVDPATGRRLLLAQIEKGRRLFSDRPVTEGSYSAWELVTRNHLEKAFGRESPNVTSITDVGGLGIITSDMDESHFERRRRETLGTQLTLLEGLVELLDTEAQLASGSVPQASSPEFGHRVFLVHGHDENVVHQVARFLEQQGLEVIVLREQPNEGRTIIEKFEHYADVGFAVVLLTPDDRGGPRDQPFEEQKYRARQNVILELGYFLGRLGRRRVCAVHLADVEIPSDYSGVLYVQFDTAGGWRLHLAKEMKAAGLPIDMNRAI